jgi:hypothetical protein
VEKCCDVVVPVAVGLDLLEDRFGSVVPLVNLV